MIGGGATVRGACPCKNLVGWVCHTCVVKCENSPGVIANNIILHNSVKVGDN